MLGSTLGHEGRRAPSGDLTGECSQRGQSSQTSVDSKARGSSSRSQVHGRSSVSSQTGCGSDSVGWAHLQLAARFLGSSIAPSGVLRSALQYMPLVLSVSKDERFRSWFDTLTTNGDVQAFRTQHSRARVCRELRHAQRRGGTGCNNDPPLRLAYGPLSIRPGSARPPAVSHILKIPPGRSLTDSRAALTI